MIEFRGSAHELKSFLKHLLRTHGIKVRKIEEQAGVYLLYFGKKGATKMAFDAEKAFADLENEGLVTDGRSSVPVWNPTVEGETKAVRVVQVNEYLPKGEKDATKLKRFFVCVDTEGNEVGFNCGAILTRIFADYERSGSLIGRGFIIRFTGMDKTDPRMKTFLVAELDPLPPELISDKAPF